MKTGIDTLLKQYEVKPTRKLLDILKLKPKINNSNSIRKKVLAQIENACLELSSKKLLNNLLIGLYLDKKIMFKNLQIKGFLRCSKYVENPNFIRKPIKFLIDNSKEIGIESELLEYLISINNLASFRSKKIKKFESTLSTEVSYVKTDKIIINNRPLTYSFIKTILVFADLQFFHRNNLKLIYNIMNENPFLNYSVEEVIEACSYIIFYYRKKYSVEEIEAISLPNEKYIYSYKLKNLILLACEIRQLMEFEVMIDRFGYICEKADKNHLKFYSKNESFEKAYRVSYIRYNSQKQIDQSNLNTEFEKVPTYNDIIKKFIESKVVSIKLVDENHLRRFILEIDSRILDFLKDIVKKDELLREDAIYFSKIEKALVIPMQLLLTKKLNSNLNIRIFYKLLKILKTLSALFINQFSESNFNDIDIIIARSLIPTFTREQLNFIFSDIASELEITEFLNILVWNPSSNKVFDLQYQPIICIDNLYLVPLSIITESNNLRNLFFSERSNNNQLLNDNGTQDFLVDELYNDLKQAQFSVLKNLKYTFNDKSGEIDILAFKDNHIYVFECKRSIHPTNIFELRTTQDYIFKAEKQLDFANNALNNEEFRKNINILKDNVTSSVPITSIIVLSNKMFCGSSLYKYPICYYSVLSNFIGNGTFSISEDGKLEEWQNKKISLNNLQCFPSYSHKLFSIYNNSLVPHSEVIRHNKKALSYLSYSMVPSLYDENARLITEKL